MKYTKSSKINFRFKKRNAGFSVLFASLIGSLVLAIGLAILSIALKQILLASAGRESQRAFYAADTGTECALFLDNGGGNEDCPNGIFPVPGQSTDICEIGFGYGCSGVDIDGAITSVNQLDDIVDGSVTYQVTETVIKIENSGAALQSNPICFDIYVTKKSADSGITVETEVESRGYSTCDVNAKNRFERAILTTF